MAPMDDRRGPDDLEDGEQRGPQENPPLNFRGLIVWILLFGVIIIGFYLWEKNERGANEVPYFPAFTQHVKNGHVKKCTIVSEVNTCAGFSRCACSHTA